MKLSTKVFSTGVLLFGIVGLQWALSGCTKKKESESETAKRIDMKTFEEDVAVPNELYSEVLKVYRPLAMDTSVEGGEGEGEKKEEHGEGAPAGRTTLKTKPTIEQVPLKVLLIEKSKGILGGQNLKLDYPAGGGLLDYRSFLQSPTPGYFLLNIEIDDLDPKDLQVFYLSRARIRKIGTKNVGNGCERYFKLTKVWNDAAKSGGMELFTGDQRHVSLTAGVFFFVFPYKGKIRMAHLTVRDSRYKDLECGKE